ncbi:hypothetical protein CERSUDRAFT_106121 [Gelatoporia subvermispora B]|uniref:BTB domain-containing protein n=1 Tax=Ceriporiopsis subvermispora (strain B) TaxID=914234 RepID=M2RF94_CERS8|nr:hypothetical protein CERSUDRAFT_106121 [Gelatoporia subvermispora B]
MSQPDMQAPETDNAAHRVVPAPLRPDSADVIIRSCDKVDYLVHKAVLSMASTVFEDMFSIPQPEDSPKSAKGLPIIDFSEDSRTLDIILRLCYPLDFMSPINIIDRLQSLLQAAQKYVLCDVMQRLANQMQLRTTAAQAPLRIYALANSFGLEEATRTAAKQMLHLKPADIKFVPELRLISAAAYHRLLEYHEECRRIASEVVTDAKVLDSLRSSAGLNRFVVKELHGPGCQSVLVKSSTNEFRMPAYIHRYLGAIARELEATPAVPIPLYRRHLNATHREAVKCQICRQYKWSDFLDLAIVLSQQVERSISQVRLIYEP